MIVLDQDKTRKFAAGWYWRCCYGCHGCCGAFFGPYACDHDAKLARAGKETMHGKVAGPTMVRPSGDPIYPTAKE
jgi:hypothetical protein